MAINVLVRTFPRARAGRSRGERTCVPPAQASPRPDDRRGHQGGRRAARPGAGRGTGRCGTAAHHAALRRARLSAAFSLGAMWIGLTASYLAPHVPPSFAVIAVASLTYLCATIWTSATSGRLARPPHDRPGHAHHATRRLRHPAHHHGKWWTRRGDHRPRATGLGTARGPERRRRHTSAVLSHGSLALKRQQPATGRG
jgi:hypothetical protein